MCFENSESETQQNCPGIALAFEYKCLFIRNKSDAFLSVIAGVQRH